MNAAIADDKAALRRVMRSRRAEAAYKFGSREFDLSPLKSVLTLASMVAGYAAIRSEVTLWHLPNHCNACCLPVVVSDGEPLIFRRWKNGVPLVDGAFGAQIPPDTADQVDPDVILVPLLAFDQRGFRLGYGGGFYDRTIQQRPGVKTIGIAFAGQQVEEVPTNQFDQALDMILTENGLLEPKNT